MSFALGPTRFPVWLLATALLGGGSLPLIASSNLSPAPVYSMTAVQAGLIRSPGAWVGRTVRVRAVVGDYCVAWISGPHPACNVWQPALLDPSTPGAEAALPLRGVPQPPLLAALRRLPLVGGLAPSPQQIRWGALATYRVRLRAAPSDGCGTLRCYEALLLDAALGSP